MTYQAIKQCIRTLDATPIEKWAETWVNLRMEFFRKYQQGFIFPNFGLDFFQILAYHIDHNKPYYSPTGAGVEYDKNFNAWLKNVKYEKN